MLCESAILLFRQTLLWRWEIKPDQSILRQKGKLVHKKYPRNVCMVCNVSLHSSGKEFCIFLNLDCSEVEMEQPYCPWKNSEQNCRAKLWNYSSSKTTYLGIRCRPHYKEEDNYWLTAMEWNAAEACSQDKEHDFDDFVCSEKLHI